MKKGNPDGRRLDGPSLILVPSALKLLRAVCNGQRLFFLNAMYPYADGQDCVIAFKSSRWPSAKCPDHEADERVVDAIRSELGLPADRPALWHFDFNDSDKVCKARSEFP